MTQTISSEELSKLFAEKGELITQLEIAQSKLQAVNVRLNQILNIQQVNPVK